MRNSVPAVLFAAFATVSAYGGQITPATMKATAQMQVTGGNLNGCGVRVLAVADDQATTFTAVDFTFNFYKNGMHLVKAGVREANLNSPKEMESPRVRQIQNFWLRAVGHPATTPGKNGLTRSDSPKGYLLYVSNPASVSPLYAAFFDKRPMQVGYRLAGEDIDRILSGTVEVADSELREVAQCISELTEAMKSDSNGNVTEEKK